jgi:hypothetical protein
MPARRTLAIAAVAAAVFAASARGDGAASPGVLMGGSGIADAVGGSRFVALPARRQTLLTKISLRDGTVERTRVLAGSYGVPLVTWNGDVAGFSPNRKLLVLAGQPPGGRVIRTVSEFLLFDHPQKLARPRPLSLKGDFSFDAISPDATRLYLVEHPSVNDLQRYRVRVYDLKAHKLVPKPVVDRSEPNMRGMPYSRVSRRDGSWVYTLYTGGHEPFVHALDTVRGRAVCLDLEWHKQDGALWRMKLRFADGGRKLAFVDRVSGRRARTKLDLARAR